MSILKLLNNGLRGGFNPQTEVQKGVLSLQRDTPSLSVDTVPTRSERNGWRGRGGCWVQRWYYFTYPSFPIRLPSFRISSQTYYSESLFPSSSSFGHTQLVLGRSMQCRPTTGQDLYHFVFESPLVPSHAPYNLSTYSTPLIILYSSFYSEPSPTLHI